MARCGGAKLVYKLVCNLVYNLAYKLLIYYVCLVYAVLHQLVCILRTRNKHCKMEGSLYIVFVARWRLP